jgi:hypothetical protein
MSLFADGISIQFSPTFKIRLKFRKNGRFEVVEKTTDF